MLRVGLSKILIGISLLLTSPIFSEQAVLSKNNIEHFLPLPLIKQSTEYTCGAAAALSLLRYFGEEALECELAIELETNSDIGTFYKTIAQVFKNKGYEIEAKDGMTLSDLKEYILQGSPVLCLVQAWASDVTDYSNYWDIGHYVIAVGYDQERIYFMDPWMIGNYAYLPASEFMNRWHQLTHENEHLQQWGMAILKNKSQFNPEDVFYLP